MFRLTVVFCLLASACWGFPRGASRILGGADADIADVPFTAAIEMLGIGHQCGAAIISAEWVLADAWCSPNPADVAKYAVHVGNSTVGGGSVHSVTKWIFHPLANSLKNQYDFALVKVTPPFEFGDNVAAVSLPVIDQETADGTRAVVTGWGEIDGNTAEVTSQLQYANVSLLNEAKCADLLGEEYNESVICGRGLNDDVALCWRDEGGPLVTGTTLLGIALWPRVCSDPKAVQKFGRVSVVRSWIDDTIRN